MYRRTWIPSEDIKKDTKETIELYDFGTICGALYENEWSSWEIISRTKDNSGCIIEILKEMPQDYVPFQILHKEMYPLYEFSKDRILIPLWTIKIEIIKHPQPLKEEEIRPVKQERDQPLQRPLQQRASLVQQQPLPVQQKASPVQQQPLPVQRPVQRRASPVQPPPSSVQRLQWPPEILEQLPRPAPRPPPRPVWPQGPSQALEYDPMNSQKRKKKSRYRNGQKGSDQNQSSRRVRDEIN